MDLDYVAIAQGLLWSVGTLSLVIAILPVLVVRAYGKIVAVALALASPLVTKQLTDEVTATSSWLGAALTTVPVPLIAYVVFRLMDASLRWIQQRVGGRYECPRCGHSLRDVENLCDVCGLSRDTASTP